MRGGTKGAYHDRGFLVAYGSDRAELPVFFTTSKAEMLAFIGCSNTNFNSYMSRMEKGDLSHGDRILGYKVVRFEEEALI